MEEHYLVLPIERLVGLVLVLQQLYQQFSLCRCLDLEVVVLLLLLMMDSLLNDLLLKQCLKTFSFSGENIYYHAYVFIFSGLHGILSILVPFICQPFNISLFNIIFYLWSPKILKFYFGSQYQIPGFAPNLFVGYNCTTI